MSNSRRSRFTNFIQSAIADLVSWIPFFPSFSEALGKLSKKSLKREAVRRLIKQGIITPTAPALVLSGPFEGMRYPESRSVGSVFLPKILGTYESELHNTIRRIENEKTYELIVDIGAAEGYYAIGLAKLFPTVRVMAFEATEEGQNLCNQMAQINGCIDRVTIHGLCRSEDLLKAVTGTKHALIFCDCEGGEVSLLLQGESSRYSNCDLLIELHEQVAPHSTISERFLEAFRKTHSATFINTCPPQIKDARIAASLHAKAKAAVLDEGREQSVGWCFLESISLKRQK